MEAGRASRPGRLDADAEYRRHLRSLLHVATLGPTRWRVQWPTKQTTPFVMVEAIASSRPLQGWKVHVSSYAASAVDTVLVTLPRLIERGVSFKVLSSVARLHEINEGAGGRSQIGKFITIYPEWPADARAIGLDLAAATAGMQAPSIPSDRRIGATPVHYRYGVFYGTEVMQTKQGEVVSALRAPDGSLVPDRRLDHYVQPPWAEDPFGNPPPPLAASPRRPASRYVSIAPIYRSSRRVVELALDTVDLRTCVIKRPAPWAPDTPAESASLMLREADSYRRVGRRPGTPHLYAVDTTDEGMALVLEDVAGETLDSAIRRMFAAGSPPTPEQVGEWGRSMAATLSDIHGAGLVHGDLKTGNVVVRESGVVKVLDLDLSTSIGSVDAPPGAGTRGYRSPQRIAGAPADVRDDIFSAGAVLYAMATGAEPSRAPDPEHLLGRPIRLLNPNFPRNLSTVIERCLEPDPQARYGSAAELAAELENPSTPDVDAVNRPQVGDQRWEDLARQTTDAICRSAKRLSGGRLVWTTRSDVERGRPRTLHDVYVGMAGTLLGLCDAAEAFRIAEHMATIFDGAWTLERLSPIPGPPRPGLYIGQAGVAVALLRSGLILGDQRLTSEAVRRSRVVSALPFDSPDIFQGTAGRLRTHLLVWDHTGEAVDLNAAIAAGDALLSQQKTDGARGAWLIPDGYGGLSGNRYLGYAHGVAGIGDALLELADVTGLERFLAAATGAANLLQSESLTTQGDPPGLAWAATIGGAPYPPFWCHGAAGIGTFMLHLAELTGEPAWREATLGCASTVARHSRWSGPTLCHGLSGNIEFLLDVGTSFADDWVQAQANDLAAALLTFSRESDSGLRWVTGSTGGESPDYLVGTAGIAATLLRLADPGRPQPLDRRRAVLRPQARRFAAWDSTLQATKPRC